MIEELTHLVMIRQGHTVFEINHITKEVVVANTYPDVKRPALIRIVKKDGCDYVSALNMKNAIKQFNKRR